MKNKRYIYISITLLILMLFCGVFSYFKITYSYFGDNLTGLLGSVFSVNYHSNYPSDVDMDSKIDEDLGKADSSYKVKALNCDIPNGYIFSHWNTKSDDSGIKYNVDDMFVLSENIDLYAIWKGSSLYGDINLDGVITMDDSALLSTYLNDNTLLVDVVLINADVNNDGNVDLIDVDIIKQAVLGTNGYEGLFLNKHVLIYDIYEGNINNAGIGNGNGTGNGNSTGTGNGKPSNNNGNSNSGNNNGNSNVTEDDLSNNIEDEIILDNNDGIVDDNEIEEKITNNKSYVWVVVVLILLVTLRFSLLIIRKLIKIKKEYKEL